MEKHIGWYTIERDSQMNQKCFDANGKQCFLKQQQIQNDEKYLEEQKIIYEKLKWNRFSNVVRILDYHYDSTQLNVFMEKCDWNLSQYIQNEINTKKNQLNLEFYQNLISQVCKGYLELKSLDMLHRDIKPDNILVVKQNDTITYKICDFDISVRDQIFDNKNEIRQTYNQKGTQAYKAPEIQNSEYSYAADMFSFGLTIFEILLGNDCFNKKKKSLQNFYEELKTKGFEQIMKEKQKTMLFNIEGDEIPQIINILNKMLAYNSYSRITWEDLYQNIYHLEELNQYQPNPQTLTEKTNNKKQLSINIIPQPNVIFTKQKQSCQNFINIQQGAQFTELIQNQKNQIVSNSQPDFKNFLSVNQQFTQKIQQNESFTERQKGFKPVNFHQQIQNCSIDNLQKKQFQTLENSRLDQQSEQQRKYSQFINDSSNQLEQNKDPLNIPVKNFGQQIMNGNFPIQQEKPNNKRCCQTLVQNQNIQNMNQFQKHNFNNNINKEQVQGNFLNQQCQSERQQINNFQKTMNNLKFDQQFQSLKQRNSFQLQ